MRIHVDLETRSLADLKLVGAYKYAQGGGDAPGDRVAPPAEVLLAAIAEGDDPPLLWVPEILDGFPEIREIFRVDKQADDLMRYLCRLGPGDTVHAFNYWFEWSICRHVLGIDIPIRHWRCTQVLADIAGLPHSLGDVAKELGVDAKLPGKALINFFCKPVTGGKRKGEFRQPDEDILRLIDLAEYCVQDVIVERAIWHKLRESFEMPANSLTRAAFEITHEMNVRGVPINETAMLHAQRQLDGALGHYRKEYVREVGCNPTQRDKSLQYFLGKGYPTNPVWFAEHGAKEGCMAKDIVEKVIEERWMFPEDLALLRLRTLLTPAAVKKLMRMRHMMAEDGNVHGVMSFYGANQTGRWASRDLQVQNMKRSTKVSINFYMALRDGATWGQLEQEFGDGATEEERRGGFVMLLSDAIRHFIDPPGRKVISADYASIEARITAWLAQEHVLLDDFESGVDVYIRMASHVFRIPVEEISKDSFERHVGKSLCLGAGFGLGWKGFMVNCGCDEKTAQLGIERYRERHKQIVNLWYRLMDAALAAIKHPGKWINANPPRKPPVRYCWKPLIKYGERLKGGGNYLICELPSGRNIYYPRARSAQATTPWGEMKPSFSYMSKEQGTGKYDRRGAGKKKGIGDRVFYGTLVENNVQGLAADVMMHGAFQVYKAGFDLRMLVHDEANAISDPERRELTSALMEQCLTSPRPKWARPRVVKGKNVRGLPLGAEGKETDFFQK